MTDIQSAARLNRDCHCVVTDVDAVRADLDAAMRSHGAAMTLAESHPYLFASAPAFVTDEHAREMRDVVRAVEDLVASEAWQRETLARADAIARIPQPSRGVFFGFDFHIGIDGPRLIEINTNAGGALLNVAARRQQETCCGAVDRPADELTPAALEKRILGMFHSEWRLARGNDTLRSVAIVDDRPDEQYLFPEFVLMAELMRSHGIRARIVEAAALEIRDGSLTADGEPVDLVYNRLTDFHLSDPAHAALRHAYERGLAVVTPHPRAHALYADKRNLARLGDAEALRRLGARHIDTLVGHVPRTRLVEGDPEAWWADRRRWFFKPVSGFGGRGAYRGDKLTRRVFAGIMEGGYIAQEIVPPGERRLAEHDDPLKIDIRCYAYAGEVMLMAARLYRGQTTNFRTPGGGFAPVYSVA